MQSIDIFSGVNATTDNKILEALFSQFGQVEACFVPPPDARQKEPSFLQFSTREAAARAVDACSRGEVTLQGVRVMCTYHVDKSHSGHGQAGDSGAGMPSSSHQAPGRKARTGVSSPELAAELEDFIRMKGLNELCARQLREIPAHMQEYVLDGTWGPAIKNINNAILCCVRQLLARPPRAPGPPRKPPPPPPPPTRRTNSAGRSSSPYQRNHGRSRSRSRSRSDGGYARDISPEARRRPRARGRSASSSSGSLSRSASSSPRDGSLETGSHTATGAAAGALAATARSGEVGSRGLPAPVPLGQRAAAAAVQAEPVHQRHASDEAASSRASSHSSSAGTPSETGKAPAPEEPAKSSGTCRWLIEVVNLPIIQNHSAQFLTEMFNPILKTLPDYDANGRGEPVQRAWCQDKRAIVMEMQNEALAASAARVLQGLEYLGQELQVRMLLPDEVAALPRPVDAAG